MEVISNKKNPLLYKYLLLLIIILLIIVSTGWVAIDYLGNTAKLEITKENENAISTLSIYFTYTIKEIEGSVETMSGSPWIAPALISRRDQDIAKANSVLDRYNSSLGISVCYLINSSGVTIASSNRKAPDSFVGNSYKFRPYFTQAMKGNRGQYLALGITSGKRGAYASRPVRDTQGNIIGVAVMKKDLGCITK